ncbi:MAG: hypothetical protein E6Q66_05915 [Pedobacter sp.]|nr:MAG: hypothetical protein E6Q66_05915 [Pedobacter sp.]
MLTSKKTQIASNSRTIQLTQTDLSCFLISCQMTGIEPDDFEKMMYIIVDLVIDGADEDSQLKKPLLFLRMLKNLLNDLKIN